MTLIKEREPIVYDKDIFLTVRRNIKRYRKIRNMTSANLAELTGLSHDYIRQIESEKSAYNFSFITFYKISIALNVTMDDLIKKEIE